MLCWCLLGSVHHLQADAGQGLWLDGDEVQSRRETDPHFDQRTDSTAHWCLPGDTTPNLHGKTRNITVCSHSIGWRWWRVGGCNEYNFVCIYWDGDWILSSCGFGYMFYEYDSFMLALVRLIILCIGMYVDAINEYKIWLLFWSIYLTITHLKDM